MLRTTCPVCGLSYAATNITNHLRKAHSGAHVSQEAAAAVGLVACQCGQVVVNAAALRKHQGIRKCQGVRSQPTAAAAAAAEDFALAQSESAPAEQAAAIIVAAVSVLAQALAPLPPPSASPAPVHTASPSPSSPLAPEATGTEADVEEENFQEIDASSGLVPSLPPSPILDFPAETHVSDSEREPDVDPEPESGQDRDGDRDGLEMDISLEIDASPGLVPSLSPHGSDTNTDSDQELDGEEDGETLPYLPQEGPAAPTQACPQHTPELQDVQDMPADGIVVLLPALDTAEEEAEAPSAPQLVLDTGEQLPKLPPIPAMAPISNWNVPVHTDVDSFAVTISPASMLQIFPAGCYASLISHAPDFKDMHVFDNWVYFAELKVVFRFEPQFKLPLVARLQGPPQHAILVPSEHAKTLTFGELRVEISILVEALQDIGCQSVRMGAYGFKVPIHRFLDPAALAEHPMQAFNVFDIGCTVDTGHVTLLAPKTKKGGYKQYPSALRIGRGFGSVELRWTHRADGISHFKAYSKLTHLLKAGAAGAGQGGQPMIMKTVKDRIATLQRWKERVSGTAPEVGSGIRLELTVQAATMQQAQQVAKASRFLDPRYLFTAQAGVQQLLTHTIKKEDMFRDLDVLLAVAEQKQLFRGNSSKQSTRLQRQAVVDLYNAMGWHPGRRPTVLDSPTAWWVSNQAAVDLAQELERFSTPKRTKNLFGHIQIHLRCQGCRRVGTYILCGGAHQFRIRCTECRATLGAQKFRMHIATLAFNRQLGVDLSTLIVDPARLLFASIPADQAVRKLSQRRDLSGLVRTHEFASMRKSMLECLSFALEDQHGGPGPIEIQEAATDWLRDNTLAVEHHIGARSRVAVHACINKLAVRDAELSTEEEVLLLHGVAGAFNTHIAHLMLLRRAWSCQVIPVGGVGPYVGLVKLMGDGYEVLTHSRQ